MQANRQVYFIILTNTQINFYTPTVSIYVGIYVLMYYSRHSMIQTLDIPNLSINRTKGFKPMLLISTNLQFDIPNCLIIQTQVGQHKSSDYRVSTIHIVHTTLTLHSAHSCFSVLLETAASAIALSACQPNKWVQTNVII